MYCIKCGVGLSNGQTVCPLCGTRVYHPDFSQTESPTYPKKEFKSEAFNRRGLLFIITILSLLPLILPVFMEVAITKTVVWSGYVAGGILLAYLVLILPLWFEHPNPVVFVPLTFLEAACFLFYVNYQLGTDWFFTLALPVVMAMCAIITALTACLYYIPHGKLYMFGGAFIAIGGWFVLLEGLIRYTCHVQFAFMWSLCPLICLFLIGIGLIVVAIVKPFKESLRKIFYVG